MHSKKYLFPLLAFFIPLLIRTIPEVLMGPYIVGFDTMGCYVPNTFLWLHNGINLWSYLATAPLFYTILLSIVAAGGPVVFALKIISPLLLGLLGLSIYVYSQKGLNWSPVKSLVPALLGTLYFVALRVSWDMLRNELGLIFLFIVLTLLTPKHSSRKRYLLLSLAMMAVVLSHQLVAVIMFGIVGLTIVFTTFRKDYAKLGNLVAFSLPAVFFFVAVFISSVLQSGFSDYSSNVGSPLADWTGFTSYQSMLTSGAGLFLYCFLPLLPLVIVSLKSFGNLQIRSWLILSLILMLIPIASVSIFRWVLMLTYPFAFYVAETLSKLKSIKWKRWKVTIRGIAIVYLVLSTATLSFGFMISSPGNPFPLFKATQNNGYNSYVNEIPTSMLQNTIPITDCQSTTNAISWFKLNLDNNSLLLTQTAFYGWALIALNADQVVNYGFDDPITTAATIVNERHEQTYLIWWVNGEGWYGLPTVPSAFKEVYQSGNIAIYNYTVSNLP